MYKAKNIHGEWVEGYYFKFNGLDYILPPVVDSKDIWEDSHLIIPQTLCERFNNKHEYDIIEVDNNRYTTRIHKSLYYEYGGERYLLNNNLKVIGNRYDVYKGINP